MLAILVMAPLLLASLLALLLRSYAKQIKYIALSASILSLIISIVIYFNQATIQNINWFSFSGYSFQITTLTLPLNMLLLFIVAFITPLIFIYSIGFMDTQSEQNRYYFEISLFAASMMLFAISGNFLTMFIAWELLGITSYLLIGFWYKKERTSTAARKAITTILIGDILMLMGILIILNSYHTLSFSEILASQPNSSLSVALLLIMLAAFTKSAQFPFHEWLPDAMEGPTPVSAFLHSSTMVKAGVFLVAVLLPLYASANLLNLILIFGLLSAILGALNALAETHIKRVLAFSTIEDLGLMFVALGLNSLLAAMLLFFSQTFYKALLFMTAGSIMKANRNEENLNKVYNSSANKPLFIANLIGVLSIAGMFPLSGFFGKAAIETLANNVVVYSALLLVEFISSLYIFRWLLIPTQKSPDAVSYETSLSYKTLPRSMLAPAYVLSAAVVLGSLSFIYLPSYLSQYKISNLQISSETILISTSIIVFAALFSYFIYKRKHWARLEERSWILYRILYNTLFMNKLYIYTTKIFAFLSNLVDSLDYSIYQMIKLSSGGFIAFGNLLKRIETGQTNTYLIAFVLGVILIVIIFLL